MIREYTETKYYARIRVRVPNGVEIPDNGFLGPFLERYGIDLNSFEDYYKGDHPNLLVLECDHQDDRYCAVRDEKRALEYLELILPEGWEIVS